MANQRRNNPLDMTVTEQIIKVREEMCDGYCKYPDVRKHGLISQESFEAVCKYDCPLNKL